MPTKQELETINDDLLMENSGLRREQTEQTQRLTELTEALQSVTARLEALAADHRQAPPAARPPAAATS